MSFSSITKNELSHLGSSSKCCAYAELAAILRVNASIRLNASNDASIKITTENAALARKVFSIMKKLYSSYPEVLARKSIKLKKHNIYVLIHARKAITWNILKTTGFITDEEKLAGVKFDPSIAGKNIIKNTCCKKSFLRGSFLGAGAVSDPEKTYHLEITVHTKELADEIAELINLFNLCSKVVIRKSTYVVYIKEGEHISDFLNLTGAHNALLELENIRIFKEMRNNVNRIVNCETANLDKTVSASIRQVENIKYIKEKIGFNHLSVSLSEIAELRLTFPDSSLKELGEMLTVPIGKSGVNHRLRKLDNIAEEMKKIEKNT